MYYLVFEVTTGRFCYLSTQLAHEPLQSINFGTQSSLQMCSPDYDSIICVII